MGETVTHAPGLVALCLVACASEAPPASVVLEHVSTRAAPGNLVHVRASVLPDALDVQLVQNGERHALSCEPPIDPEAGAVYVLPRSLTPGQAALQVRRAGIDEARAEAPIEVISPWFELLDTAVGLDAPHEEITEGTLFFLAGAAAADLDGDGDPELFVSGGALPAKLYVNEVAPGGLPRFVDRSDLLGPPILRVGGSTFADLDGDGDQDLFVGRDGGDRLFVNLRAETGQLAFEERSGALGLGHTTQTTTGAAFGDYDGDGDLDLFVVHDALEEDGDPVARLYRQDPAGFVDASEDLHLRSPGFRSFAAAWFDVDGDGDVDLVAVTDNLGKPGDRPSVLWRNDGPGDGGHWRFTDASQDWGIAQFRDSRQRAINAMGLAIGDLDRDGAPDLVVTNIGPNLLFHNVGGHFEEIGGPAGIRRERLPWGGSDVATSWSVTWAAHAFDFDLDGDLDVTLIGGNLGLARLRQVPHALFEQTDSLRFVDRSEEAGLLDPRSGLASVVLDANGDGWLDFVVVYAHAPAALFLNRGARFFPGRHWLGLRLQGTRSNRDAVGSVVTLTSAEGRKQTCFLDNRPGYGGGGERLCHFGTGTDARPVTVDVRWPSGRQSHLRVDALDRYLDVVEE